MPSFSSNSFLVLLVLVFVAVLLLLEGLYLMWRAQKGPEAKKLQSRLHALSASRDRTAQTQVLKQRMLGELPMMDRMLESIPRIRVLDRAILQSGMSWSVSKVLMWCATSMLVVGMATYIGARMSLWISMLAGLLGGALPFMYVMYKKNQRMSRLERQLPDALDLIIRALRAGHAFSSALKMTGEEMPEPIAGEFRIVHDEINFGVSLQQALSHLSERVPLTDLRYFVVAVLIQRESGGNLTEILANLGRLIRERLKLLAKVKVLSSEGRMSAWILTLMPFFLAFIMNLANPDFMRPLWTDPLGITIVQYMLTLMAFGVFIMRRIVRIRV
jgi:tight adherence protein B